VPPVSLAVNPRATIRSNFATPAANAVPAQPAENTTRLTSARLAELPQRNEKIGEAAASPAAICVAPFDGASE
jgi:hypothetical protein